MKLQPPAQDRAAGILLENGAVLLIERRKSGELYWVTPGGKVEAGETPQEACAREMLEEVNLDVEVGELIGTFPDEDRTQYFFLVRRIGGEVRLGDGPEAARESDENHYAPAWIPLKDLKSHEIRPSEAAGLIRRAARGEREDRHQD